MSNIEHLLENAIATLKRGNCFEDFMALWHTPIMLEGVKSSPEEIWEMAQYVVFSHDAEPVRHGCPYCCDNGEGGHGRLKYSYDDHDGMTMSIHPSEKRKDGTRSLAWWATVHFRGECRDFYIEVCPFCGRRLVPLKEEHDCTSPNCSAKMDGNQ